MEPHAELGHLCKQMNTRLYESFGQINIRPWYAKPLRGVSRGSAGFSYYDPISTALQTLPNFPRFFEASVRSGLLSNAAASLLTHRLVDLSAILLAKYDGHYALDLKKGRVGKIIEEAQKSRNWVLAEAYDGFIADELYAAMLWPCFLDVHLTRPTFSAFEVDVAAFQRASQSPLEALSVAVDIVNIGPSLGLRVQEIHALLNCLETGEMVVRPPKPNKRIHKIYIPHFSQGLQGFTFGVFTNLTFEQQRTVMNRLLQYGSTFEELCLYDRRRRSSAVLQKASNLRDIADALLLLMPPVEELQLQSEDTTVVYRLRFEQGYCAGYAHVDYLPPQAPSRVGRTKHVVTLEIAGRQIDVFVTPLCNYPQLDPDMVMLRLAFSLVFGGTTVRPEALSANPGRRCLSLRDLQSVRRGLLEQPLQGRGAQLTCRCLYLIEAIIQCHDKGEALISNDGARRFMQERMGENAVSGYQVAAKALTRLRLDTEKILPNALRFTSLTSNTVKVSWEPQVEEATISA